MRFRNSQVGTSPASDALQRQAAASVEWLRARGSGRRVSDWLLFGVTAAELIILVFLNSGFTAVDWIYLLQHLWVIGIALIRLPPVAEDRSLASSVAVGVSYAYPYAQMIDVQSANHYALFPDGGLVLVVLSACLSLASLISIGRLFGLLPALRGLATRGPYALVRHPLYLAYVLSDVGYELYEWNPGSLMVMLAGWAALLYRIFAEERVLSQDPRWPTYARKVPYRLFPGFW